MPRKQADVDVVRDKQSRSWLRARPWTSSLPNEIRASRPIVRSMCSCLGAALLLVACGGRERSFVLPTAPTSTVDPSPTPQPPAPIPPTSPRPRAPTESDVNEISVGETFQARVSAEPPECVREPGWPCQYFRLTAPNDGTLTVALTYRPDTQPPGRGGPQGVDVSAVGNGLEVWADFFNATATRLSIRVTGGVAYEITLWYTFPNLEYELQTSLLKHGHTPSAELRKALVDTIRHELGPVAVIGEMNFVGLLPKTRSGKIMRRVLKAVLLDRDPGDITTIEDEGSVEEARQAWLQMKSEVSRHKV
jgi:AMP-binding enzyme C-terminal domain